MKIALESRWITFERTGFGNYALNLLKELAKIDNINEYYIYLNRDYKNDQIFSKPNFKKIVIPRIPEFYKHISIPLDIIQKRRGYDFFHFLYNAPSLFLPCKFILTIHDVSYKHIKNMVSKRNLLSITFQLFIKARKAKKIITVSKNSKKDIIHYFKVPEEKIEVIYEGVDDIFRPIEDEKKKRIIINKYGLPPKFILYVGTYLPHKNLGTLLHAYYDLKKHKKIKHALVFAGRKGRNYATVKNLISKLKLENDLILIGYVEDEDLPFVYNLSDLFVFPSLYEGFGLPLLEAMACGVPVLSSNSSCLPEIGGNAVLYFNPNNPEELGRKIIDVLTNVELKNQLIERGIQRARLFTWRSMAEKTLEVYEKIYKDFCDH